MLLPFLFFIANALAQETPNADVVVRSTSLHTQDEVSYTPHSVAIERPPSDIQLGETLAKLPGVLVLNYSGPGSLTTAITPQSIGSAGTGVSIDDIPVLNPMGGFDFSSIPHTLIERIEQHSPFYPSLDPTADTLPAPGGRMDLKTLGPPREKNKPWRASVLAGSGKTAEGSLAYQGGDSQRDYVLGARGFSTGGDFRYRDPRTGTQRERDNNDANGGGALFKHRWHLRGSGELELLDFVSHANRTNPGHIDFPMREHERDTFNLIGMRYQDPKAISDQDGLFGKLAGAYSRTDTRGGPGGPFNNRSWANYAQAGYSRHDEATSITVAFDNEYDHLRSESGPFYRDNFGATATMGIDVGDFRFVPLVRQESSTVVKSVGDASMSAIYRPDVSNDVTLSYGVQHLQPPLVALSGFRTSGYTITANRELKVERDNIVSLSYNRRQERYALYSNAFYNKIKNRNEISFAPPDTLRFVNLSQVHIWGYTLDGQVFPSQRLSFRASATALRAWDEQSGHELQHKPRLRGLTSATVSPLNWLAFTAEEQFTSKQFASNEGVEAVAPFAQTNVRADLKIGEGVGFFKVSNIFDKAGFLRPGYPYPGRSYWLGYTLGGYDI